MKELLDSPYLLDIIGACFAFVMIVTGAYVMCSGFKRLLRSEGANFDYTSDWDDFTNPFPEFRQNARITLGRPRARRVSTPPVFRRRPSLPSRGFFL